MTVARENFNTKFWVEGDSRICFTLAKLCNATGQTRSIIELSTFIQIEAWALQLRFQVREKLSKHPFYICCCHPDTTHDGPPLDGSALYDNHWADLILCEQPSQGNMLYDRLGDQKWTCVLLFTASLPSSRHLHNLLVVDWHGDVAYRIGTTSLESGPGTQSSFESLPKARRTIRLH